MHHPHVCARLGLSLAAALILAACATGSSPDGSPDVSGNWQEVGLSGSGNVRHAIDQNSIRRQGGLATFRDKKTVIDVAQERYSNTPAYKVAVGDWEMDCARKTYRLNALQLLDSAGQSIGQYRYGSTDLRPMAVVRGSATEKQYELVCGQKL